MKILLLLTALLLNGCYVTAIRYGHNGEFKTFESAENAITGTPPEMYKISGPRQGHDGTPNVYIIKIKQDL